MNTSMEKRRGNTSKAERNEIYKRLNFDLIVSDVWICKGPTKQRKSRLPTVHPIDAVIQFIAIANQRPRVPRVDE